MEMTDVLSLSSASWCEIRGRMVSPKEGTRPGVGGGISVPYSACTPISRTSQCGQGLHTNVTSYKLASDRGKPSVYNNTMYILLSYCHTRGLGFHIAEV